MSQADTESYTAAKGGISALTHALAISLAGKVRVNSVNPGWIDVSANFEVNHSLEDKNQHPVKRVGKPGNPYTYSRIPAPYNLKGKVQPLLYMHYQSSLIQCLPYSPA